MRSHRVFIFAAVVMVVCLPALASENGTREGSYIEKWDNDIHKIEAFYKQGLLHGRYQEFFENGRLKIRAQYVDDKRVGPYQEYNAEGKLILQCAYVDGKKDGRYQLYHDNGRLHIQASYAEDRLQGAYQEFGEDGRTVVKEAFYIFGADRFPRKAAEITAELKQIEFDELKSAGAVVAPPVSDAGGTGQTGQAGGRPRGPRNGGGGAAAGSTASAASVTAALTRLKQARAIAGVPYADITLKDSYMAEAQAAADLLAVLGKLDHHPSKPAGIGDEPYRLGLAGCQHGNLAMGMRSLADAVTVWQYDSDDTNKDRVGHRRWDLNPAMLQTGFGQNGKFMVIWAHDSGRTTIPDYTTIAWPAAGYHPASFFGARWCWNVSLNPAKFRTPEAKDITVKMWALDRNYLKTGKVLELDHFVVNTEPYGVRYAVIWRPKTADVSAGKAFYVEIEGLKTTAGEPYVYNGVTEFIP